jgi:hypothetical protein
MLPENPLRLATDKDVDGDVVHVLPGDTVTLRGEIENPKSFELVATDKVKPADVLVKSLLSPLYVAVSVRDPVVEKLKLQLPVPPERVPVQLSPVLLLTMTLCVGLPYPAVTLKLT